MGVTSVMGDTLKVFTNVLTSLGDMGDTRMSLVKLRTCHYPWLRNPPGNRVE